MCGEKHPELSRPDAPLGSPPHVRGKERRQLTMAAGERITPACAGKRQVLGSQHTLSQDHPRMCGEKERRVAGMDIDEGSPPHVRGKDTKAEDICTRVRITPACAGKSLLKGVNEHEKKDHPRMCGEKQCDQRDHARNGGSPPHVRGKDPGQLDHLASRGITPACAGKSIRCTSTTRLIRDHPRMCGEKAGIRAGGVCRIGSPPHVRGKAPAPAGFQPPAGITPACAGKSRFLGVLCLMFQDHPRMCGEKKRNYHL